jgi:hypothetical protein
MQCHTPLPVQSSPVQPSHYSTVAHMLPMSAMLCMPPQHQSCSVPGCTPWYLHDTEAGHLWHPLVHLWYPMVLPTTKHATSHASMQVAGMRALKV